MAGEKVGSIYYEVEADTSKLVNSLAAVDESLDKLNKTFARTDRAANDANFKMKETAKAVQNLGSRSSTASVAMDGLARVMAGLLSIKTATILVQMAESYSELAERIRFATGSAAEYDKVQSRLLDTANGTYRALSEAQEIYIMTADSLRSLGYSTDQVLDITDSLSYAFVKNATSTDRAGAAMSAYTKAVNKGRVDTDGWQSILMAIPTVVDDIATATGRSAAQVRELGFSGKLAAKDLNEGLRQSLEDNKAAADGMATKISDALIRVRNNLQAYIGEANRSTGVTTDLAGAIARVAEAIQSADPADLVREINAMKTAMEVVNDLAEKWLEPFNLSVDDATSGFVTSFADSFLATGREIDTIAADFQGFFGGIEKAVGVLGGNITTILSRAWNLALKDASDMLNSMIDGFNKVSDFVNGPQMGKVSFGSDITRETVSLIDAYADGYHKAAKGVGAHNAILDKMTDKIEVVAKFDWQTEYGEKTNKAAAATGSLTEKTEKLSAAQKKAIKDEEANKKVVDDLAAALMLAGTEGEKLAIAKATSKLNVFATPEEVQQVKALAAAMYEMQQAKTDQALINSVNPMEAEQEKYDAQVAAFQDMLERKKISQGEYDAYMITLKTAHDEAMAELTGENWVLTQELETERYETDLAALTTQLMNEEIAYADYYARIQALQETHAANSRNIEQARGKMILAATAQSFDAATAAIGSAFGEQNALYKAMFVASKAFAIAEAAIKIQQGIAAAWALPFPANLPAVATVVAGTASILGAIGSVSMGGGRQYGGPVAPDGMYRINENRKPEVLNMANGQQFLLPNSRGEVVSNADATRHGPGNDSTTTINNIHLGGVHLSTSWPPDDKDIRTLVEKINDAVGDGMILRAKR